MTLELYNIRAFPDHPGARDRGPVGDVVVLVQEDFLRGADLLARAYLSTAPGRATLENYLVWRLLADFYPDRSPNVAERRERCVKETEELFAPAVTSLYIKAKGVEASEAAVDEV